MPTSVEAWGTDPFQVDVQFTLDGQRNYHEVIHKNLDAHVGEILKNDPNGNYSADF
jgi:hypothetical protein